MLKHETFKEKNLKRQGDLEMSGKLTAVRVGNVMDFLTKNQGNVGDMPERKSCQGKVA